MMYADEQIHAGGHSGGAGGNVRAGCAAWERTRFQVGLMTAGSGVTAGLSSSAGMFSRNRLNSSALHLRNFPFGQKMACKLPP